MGKAALVFIVSLVVGVIASMLGREYLGGFSEIGTLLSISVAGGFVVYFQDKENRCSK